jgi:hypothetical protein
MNIKNVVTMEGVPTLPKDILERAKEIEFDHVIVLGRTTDGSLYQDTSTIDGRDILVLLEQGKFDIIHNLFGG